MWVRSASERGVGEPLARGHVVLRQSPDEGGESVVAAVEIATGQTELPRRADGRHFRAWGMVSWLGDQRLVFWDLELDQPVVWDIRKQEARLLDGIPGPSEFNFTADGRKLVINYTAEESDIWLLTLAE